MYRGNFSTVSNEAISQRTRPPFLSCRRRPALGPALAGPGVGIHDFGRPLSSLRLRPRFQSHELASVRQRAVGRYAHHDVSVSRHKQVPETQTPARQ